MLIRSTSRCWARLASADRGATGPGRLIETGSNGYVPRVAPEQVDLHRYQRLATEGDRALAEGKPALASVLPDEAPALWHGPALATYQRVRRTLIDKLGLEPGEQLRATQQAVSRGVDP